MESRTQKQKDEGYRQNGTDTPRVCLNCGMILVYRQCKVRCVRCGYFEDCSDGGNDPTHVMT